MNRDTLSDLASGVAAAVSFLVLTFALSMHLMLAAVLSVGIYFGVRLLTAQGPARVPTDQEVVNRIYQLRQRVPDERFRARIDDICRKAVSIISYFKENAEDAVVWRPFFRESLDSTLRIVTRYADVARHLELLDRAALTEFEELLESVSQTLGNLLAKLIADDAAGLAEEAQVFKTTLQALNEVNLLRGGGEPR